MSKKKIIISPYSGFCFGVKRALEIAEGALKKKKMIYSLGPIIHNPQVVKELSSKGLKIINSVNIVRKKTGAVLIPSHGVSPSVLKNENVIFIDTTCPFVNRVQNIVKRLKKKGYFIVIVGDKKHAEVKGLMGIAGKKALVLKDKAEAKHFNVKSKKLALISQTTASLSSFRDVLSEIAKKDLTELVSYNTVCKNTTDRQNEARRIARKVDAMIIVGGKNSANTTKLAKTCRKVNKSTYHIESEKDLKTKSIKKKNTIGIATGASTPPYAIEEVVKKIRRIG